ncbi:hypothetical protein CPB83DRAFT_899821 [Crepidotus variabilis]|uniref:NACHT domain-containing protein n=1 Tax=Crepidotus variabilis TaxID=179855 RepID=A0A9P6E458_9AGAR|nr:hypothetical protein CPB83DRAFT_899821 [Crepidotus variabilis]
MQKSGFFENSSNVAIVNSNLHMAVNQTMDPSAALRFLYEAMAKHAGSGHQDPSTCLEGTRTSALEEIDEWKRKTLEEQSPEMIWLTGSAGSGKTAIAQTVYEQFKEEGLLVVQTSFFRSTGCTNLKYLPLSIAYQLAEKNSLLKASIEAVIQASPAVIDAPIHVQLQRLVLGPIAEAADHLPMVYVVLDGLDECGVEDQQIQIIRLIQAIITDQHLPIRFLIASRPESWIQTSLLSPSAPPLSTIFLNQDEEADDDIHLFYETEFKKIRNDPRHIHSMTSAQPSWPSTDVVKQLVEWASGQFIYAKTVTRFVGEPGHSPIRRLEIVLQPNSELTKSQSPLDRLDALYSQVLSCVVNWKITGKVLGALSVFISYISGTREALSIIEVVLGLNSGDAYLALRNLHPLVFVPSDLTLERERMPEKEYKAKLIDGINGIQLECPHFYHKSFTDFLHHPQRAGKYFIDTRRVHSAMAIGCLKVLQGVNTNPPTRLFSVTWQYAYYTWDFHCHSSGFKRNNRLLTKLENFSFISWYFISPDFLDRWKQMGPLFQLEIWNDDALAKIQNINKTLEGTDLYLSSDAKYSAFHMWNWFKTSVDTLSFSVLLHTRDILISSFLVGGLKSSPLLRARVSENVGQL